MLRVKVICVPCSEQDEILEFKCPVGGKSSKRLAVRNDSSEPWSQIRAEISHSTWRLKQPLIIPPKTAADVDIEFCPAADLFGEVRGTLKLYFPNGGAQKIRLHGLVEAAIAQKSMDLTLPLRKPHTKRLSIWNPTSSLSKFQVTVDRQQCPEAVIVQV